MFEHYTQPLLPTRVFIERVLRSFLVAASLIVFSLGIGIVGYHHFGHLNWIDSFLNASMILTGMGPVDPMTTPSAKLFAGFYALFSGVAFLTMVAVLFAPVIHRFFHKFHLDIVEDDDEAKDGQV